MDTPTYPTRKMTSLALSFSRQWPWLRWRSRKTEWFDPRTSVPILAKSGHLYSLLKVAAFRAGVDLPERSAFHIFRHTYA
jgi:hypothetical protein